MGEDEEGEDEASEDEASYHLSHGGGGHFGNTPQESHASTILAVQGQIQELLQKLLAKYLDDSAIVEGVCELLHRCCKALMGEFGPLVDGTARLVGDMYGAAPQGSMLTLANQLTLVYHREKPHLNAIVDMFRVVCVKSVSLFQTTTSSDPPIRELPDVAESFFRYISMVFRKCPSLVEYCLRGGDDDTGRVLTGSEGTMNATPSSNGSSTSSSKMDVTPLIHCGIVGLKMPENPTVKAACGFLGEFVSQSSSSGGSGGIAACQRVLADQVKRVLEEVTICILGRRSCVNLYLERLSILL